MIGMTIDGFVIEPGRLVIVRDQIAIPLSRPGSLKIVVLTDLHVGSPHNGIDNLERVVELTNTQQPDIVCILGDLVIQGVRGGHFVSPEDSAAVLKRLRSRLGSFAVLGNHDVWLDHDRVAAALESNGIDVIEDTAVRLDTSAGPLWLAGVGDFMTGRARVATGLAHVTDDAPVIILSHNPDIFPLVSRRVALTLAGHTHGGQVRLPFDWTPIVPSMYGQKYAAGRVVEDGKQMYVSTGVGTSLIPVRFRVPPAVTLLTLHAE
jgi:predicted MPP superfamily phosphohydrolase